MLLEILSNIDLQTTNLREEDLITILSSTNQEEYFATEDLENMGLSKDCINEVIILIKNGEIGKVFYSYDCEKEKINEITDSLEDPCEYCGESITKSNHFIKALYTLHDQLYEEYEDQKKEEFNTIVPREYQATFLKLKREIANIVPFLGSGISIPLGLPSWTGLIREMKEGLGSSDFEQFESYLKDGDVFSAIDILQNSSLSYRTEEQIKNFISEFIDNNIRIKLADKYHNINDILNLESDFYITTNYDTALSKYKQDFILPVVLNDVENMQSLLKEKKHRIIHLHGISDRKSSMVFTKRDYEKVYKDDKNKGILNGIMSSKSLLFIGFSFTDKYFKDLYEILKNEIGGTHYIILSDLHIHKARQLIDMGLEPIGINVNNRDVEGKYENHYNNEYTQRFVDSLKIIINNLID